jgi:hypothetical protein
VASATQAAKFQPKTYPRAFVRSYIHRALLAEGVISSDVAMAEQGAVRRQRASGIQVCANCAGLFAVERREAQRPTSLGARASQAVTLGNQEWP